MLSMLHFTLYLLSAVNTSQPASEIRLAVVVGNNIGLSHEQPLDYAEEDAKRFHELLLDIGSVDPDRAYLLIGKKAHDVLNALIETTGRLHEHPGKNTSVIVYISSHADESSLHLNGTRLMITELRNVLDRMPARFRLVIVDACRTALSQKTKGGRPVAEVPVAIDKSVRVEGEVFITSAGPGERAQEWTYLRGALFSHHLMTALRGAADYDDNGKISLTEAYSYAFRTTNAHAVRKSSTPQRPSYEFRFQGFGEWTFTQPSKMGASILLDKQLSGTFWIADRSNHLVAEVGKIQGSQLKIAVQPGWYRVVRPEGDWAYACDVHLHFGGQKNIHPDQFLRLPRQAVKLRGNEPILLRPWHVGMGYSLSNGSLQGIGWMHHLVLSIERELGSWFAGLILTGARNSFQTLYMDIDHWQLGLHLIGGYRIPWWMLTIDLGFEIRSSLLHQKIKREHAQEIEDISGIVENNRNALQLGSGFTAKIGLPISERLWIWLHGASGIYRVPLWTGQSKISSYHETGLVCSFSL